MSNQLGLPTQQPRGYLLSLPFFLPSFPFSCTSVPSSHTLSRPNRTRRAAPSLATSSLFTTLCCPSWLAKRFLKTTTSLHSRSVNTPTPSPEFKLSLPPSPLSASTPLDALLLPLCPTMRESNFNFPAQNRACVCISQALYDRRGEPLAVVVVWVSRAAEGGLWRIRGRLWEAGAAGEQRGFPQLPSCSPTWSL